MKNILVLTLIIPSFGLAQESQKISQIYFYGFENPQKSASSPHVSLDRKVLKNLPKRLFSFEGPSQVEPPSINRISTYYFIQLLYKENPSRTLKIYPLDGIFWVKEGKNWWLIPDEKFPDFEVLMFVFKNKMFDELDVLLGEKQLALGLSKEDSLFHTIRPILQKKLSIRPSVFDLGQDSIASFASELIYWHLELFERFYNFPRIRRFLLNSFKDLAQVLVKNSMPSRLVVGGIAYMELFKLKKKGNEWQCQVASDVVFHHMPPAYRVFNEVIENLKKE